VNCIFYNFFYYSQYIFIAHHLPTINHRYNKGREENNNNNTVYQIRLRFCKTKFEQSISNFKVL